ncbi:MAG: hypothetical protein K8R55_10385 [Desulfuromonadaceae bacterium]|nr:hypothetical protein [Desulfuromonadaceae bacterium]
MRDPALRRVIRTEYGNDRAPMTDASLLIIMTADVKAWQKDQGGVAQVRQLPLSELGVESSF